MGDLARDTAVEGGGGRYRAHLSRDWDIWGPNGGYLAVIALRAAGLEGGLPRPASFACQFLNVANFHDVELTVTTLRASKRSAALRVEMQQDDTLILTALAWVVDDALTGLAHDDTSMPDVPRPEDVPSFEERRPGEKAFYPFWENVEAREVTWTSEGDAHPAPPVWRAWLRFRPTATFADPFLDAGRALLLLDTMCWPAAVKPYMRDELTHLAPSLDVAAQFHQLAPGDEWLLCDAAAPVAAGGLIGANSRIWTRNGRLLATGGQQMLCRPVPQPPSE